MTLNVCPPPCVDWQRDCLLISVELCPAVQSNLPRNGECVQGVISGGNTFPSEINKCLSEVKCTSVIVWRQLNLIAQSVAQSRPGTKFLASLQQLKAAIQQQGAFL